MPTDLQVYSSFVPPGLVARLVSPGSQVERAGPPGPRSWGLGGAEAASVELEGVLLFADISGFTRLAEKLAPGGADGAEELTRVVNEWFGRLIERVKSHGGESVKFVGDALLAAWIRDQEPAAETVCRASRCALEILDDLAESGLEERYNLSLRGGIGAGGLVLARIGGVGDRWEVVVAGEAVAEFTLALAEAPKRTMVLSPRARRWAVDRIVGDGAARGCLVLKGVHGAGVVRPAVPPSFDETWIPLLRAHVSLAIREHLRSGLDAWISERRTVTVLFFNLCRLDWHAPGAIFKLHRALVSIQESLDTHGAVLDKVSIDEKGTTVMAALGLPSHDVPTPGIVALDLAFSVQDHLEPMGLGCSVGIGTGTVFCGLVGNANRREYTLIGDVVNVAARLMKVLPEAVICDHETFQATRNRARFKALEPISVSRDLRRVHPYQVLNLQDDEEESTPAWNPAFGRAEELDLVDTALLSVLDGRTSTLLFHGEMGMGKSLLVREMERRAEERGIRILDGAGQWLLRGNAYHPWSTVFCSMMGIRPEDPAEVRIRRLEEYLERWPRLAPMAPLLYPVIHVGERDSTETRRLEGAARVERTHQILVRLLEERALDGPLAVVLEDAQWMDSASWQLAWEVSQRVRPLLLVVSTRPLPEPVPKGFQDLSTSSTTVHTWLRPLANDAILRIVCTRLGIRECPAPVVSWVYKRSGGNPLFAEELVRFLVTSRLLVVEKGEVQSSPDDSLLASIPLPDSLTSIMIARVDRLQPRQILLLKSASVIGGAFDLPTLRRLWAYRPDREKLEDDLRILEKHEYIARVGTGGLALFSFVQNSLPEALYNLMSREDRRVLHRVVAEIYVSDLASAPRRPDAVLAHHWSLAEDHSRAVVHLEKAGDQAIRAGAFREAIDFYRKAQVHADRLDPAVASEVPSQRRARWDTCLGDAHFALGDLERGRSHYQNALGRLGMSLPTTRVGLGAWSTMQAVVHVLISILPARLYEVPAAERLRYVEAAQSMERLAERNFYTDPLFWLATGLACANLVQRAGKPWTLARPFGVVGFLLANLRFSWLADRYFARAAQVGESQDDPVGLAVVLYIQAACDIGFGAWDRARAANVRALEVCRGYGDTQQEAMVQTELAMVAYYQSQYRKAAESYADLLLSARSRSNLQHEAWALYGLGQCGLSTGRLQEAVTHIRQALALLARVSDMVSVFICQGMLAALHQRLGEHEAAAAAAEEAEQCLKKLPVPLVMAMYEGYAGLAEYHLGTWRMALASGVGDTRLLRTNAQRAVRAFRRFALAFPFAVPRRDVLVGQLDWLEGAPRKAREAWTLAAQRAVHLGMPLEQALAWHHLGVSGDRSDPLRRRHIQEAREMYRRLGCPWYLARLESEADQDPGPAEEAFSA